MFKLINWTEERLLKELADTEDIEWEGIGHIINFLLLFLEPR